MEEGTRIITVDGEVYIFEQTCSAFPEQYDVFDSKGEEVGYVRLRHDVVTAESSAEVFSYGFYAEEVKGYGQFVDEEERMFHLQNIANAIHTHRHEVKKPKMDFLDFMDVLFEGFPPNDNETRIEYITRITEIVSKDPERYKMMIYGEE